MDQAVSRQLADNPRLDVEVRFLEPDEWWRIAPLFESESAPLPDARFSRVIVAMDGDTVAGVMVAQMVLHVEPIIVKREYRSRGVWQGMAEMMDGYLSSVGVAGAYAQPVHDSTKHMAKQMGYVEMEHALWLKIYDPAFQVMFPEGKE